jgi:GH18 family chitinase
MLTDQQDWTYNNKQQLSDEWADAQIDVAGAGDIPATKGCLNSFALLKKKYSRLRVVLSVGGGGKGSEPFAAVARDPSRRERFAQTALGLVQQFGIDGIDSKFSIPALQHELTNIQSTGSTPRTPARVKTTSPSLQPCVNTSQDPNIRSPPPSPPANGPCNTSTSQTPRSTWT